MTSTTRASAGPSTGPLALEEADRHAVDLLAGALRRAVPDGRLGVAFSGGVDSATLLGLAARTLGPARVLAILGVSPSLASDERTAKHHKEHTKLRAKQKGNPNAYVCAAKECGIDSGAAWGPARGMTRQDTAARTISDA